MQFSVLGSGSRGNAVYIEAHGTAILIDAGFSGKEIGRRLAQIGKTLEDLEGCLEQANLSDQNIYPSLRKCIRWLS